MSMTSEELREQDRKLRLEADAFLERYNIRAILQEYGRVHVCGSHALRLMTWRSLDLFVEFDLLSSEVFLELGFRLGRLLKPRSLAFSDHHNFPATQPIKGLHWVVETDLRSRGGWTLDVWGLTPTVCAERLAYCDALCENLTPQLRQVILAIKNAVCQHAEYRKTISSQTVYEIVLRHGITSADEFWKILSGPVLRNEGADRPSQP